MIPSGGATVLVVDDEPAILDALEDLLEDDFRVLKATSGAEGLHLLQQHTVSVVLSDQKMPGMKGEEFLARVAEGHVATRVLLTGYTDFEDLVRAVNRGHIYAFVSKPWSPHQLRSLVRAAAERYDLERKLVYEKNLLALLLENTPDLISIKDSQGRYLRLNTACANALGFDHPDTPLGQTDQDMGGGIFPEASGREQAILGGDPAEMDVTERSGREPRWYSTTRVSTPSKDGPPLLIGISRDITERLENNRRLEQHASQLERMNRELSRVSFIVAHHLQEPLRLIGSFTDLLQRRELLKEGAGEYIGYVNEGVQRAKSLMRDFSSYLDMQQPAEKDLVSLPLVVEAALASLKSEHPALQVRHSGAASVPGYPELLTQLMRSLLDNALVHGDPEKEIVVVIEGYPGHAQVTIEDEGPGIPEEDHSRVFRLFETLETGTRSGLGLALCQKIVEQHGGEIWLANRTSGGLRVAFTLSRESEASRPLQGPATLNRPGIEPVKGPAKIAPAHEETELKERLARVEAFAATAAHDLHEPLRMVSSYLKLLERRESAKLSESGIEYLGYAVNGAQRMKALIDGLLAHAVSGKAVPGERRPLSELMPEVLSDLEVAISEAQAEVKLGGFPSDLLLGEVQGRQLLSNLVANALKYRSDSEPLIIVTAEARETEFLVMVEDNGIGVPEDFALSIFEPFVRGDHDRLYRGTGLGLATCRRLVESWGGRIWCEPSPHAGTRFLFTVPR